MSTVNISLPEEQLHTIDNLVSSYGFANRSEFLRAIIRFLTRKTAVLDEIATFPFSAPSEKSAKKIVSGFRKTGKYSRGFLKDLEDGLRSSDYFDK